MVKVYAPALSLDASGSLAGALVFSKWKGRNYIRQLVKPANPKAVKQVSVRAMFKFLSQEWTSVDDAGQASWDDRADDKIISPFNAFMSLGQTRHRNGLTPSWADPPTTGGTGQNLNWLGVTAGVRQATVNFTAVDTADGWGVLIARSTTDGFTPGFGNVVAVFRTMGAGTHDYIDTPLVAGTYYYRVLKFMRTGEQAAAWIAQESVVVTDT